MRNGISIVIGIVFFEEIFGTRKSLKIKEGMFYMTCLIWWPFLNKFFSQLLRQAALFAPVEYHQSTLPSQKRPLSLSLARNLSFGNNHEDSPLYF